jgi:hypothetical protein
VAEVVVRELVPENERELLVEELDDVGDATFPRGAP